MDVVFVPAAEDELDRLPVNEKFAILNAIEKLEALGDTLPYPHSSAVRGTKLRELRPRSGRSPWRAFYRRVEDLLVIAAIGPKPSRIPMASIEPSLVLSSESPSMRNDYEQSQNSTS